MFAVLYSIYCKKKKKNLHLSRSDQFKPAIQELAVDLSQLCIYCEQIYSKQSKMRPRIMAQKLRM